MTTWEYLRVSTEIATGPEAPADAEAWMARLASLGADGWEAVTPVVLHDQRGDARFLLMKRASTS